MAERRKFVYAPVMEELARKVESIRDVAAQVEAQFEQIRDSDDWKCRFEVLVLAIQDHERGICTTEELQERCRFTLEDVIEDVIPEVNTQWSSTPT